MSLNHKNTYLLAGIMMLFIMAYFFAFKKTADMYRRYKNLIVKEQLSINTPNRLKKLQEKITEYNTFLNSHNISGTSTNNSLLKTVNELTTKKNILIKEFNDPHIFLDPNTQSKITTYRFNLEGSYPNIINSIYQLEQRYSFGNITHVDFEKKKNYRTGKYRLGCDIHVQRLEVLE